jgi:hypothetical protein
MFVSKSSVVLFENQFVLTLWLATFVFMAAAVLEARLCPRDRNEIKKRTLYWQRSPAADINTLLAPGRQVNRHFLWMSIYVDFTQSQLLLTVDLSSSPNRKFIEPVK